MKETTTDLVSKNLLQFCYTCDDAALCTSEEVCRHCWADNGIPVDEEETNDISAMINHYHE